MLLQAFLVGLAAAIGQSDYLLGTAMVLASDYFSQI